MIVWEIQSNSNYLPLIPMKLLPTGNVSEMFEGKHYSDIWDPPPIRLWVHPERTLRGDFPFIDNTSLCCGERAYSILKSLLSEEVEFLPIRVTERLRVITVGESEMDMRSQVEPIPMENYWLMNIVNVVDCLDETRSQLKSITVRDGRVAHMGVRYAVFKEDMLNKVHLFKIPQIRRTLILGTPLFRDLIEKNDLTGLDFSVMPGTVPAPPVTMLSNTFQFKP